MPSYTPEYGELAIDFNDIEYWIDKELNTIDYMRWCTVEKINTGNTKRERSGKSAGEYAHYLKRKSERQDRKTKAIKKRRAEFAQKRALILLQMLERGDEYICSHVDCEEYENLTIDHIKPIARGGTDELENFQFMCGRHNSEKGGK